MRKSDKVSRWWLCGLLTVALTLGATSGAVADEEDYLIITAPAYSGSAPLTQFANAKVLQGYKITEYSVPSGTSNSAIKAYIVALWSTADAPAFVLLVGDTSGSSSTTTTLPHFSGGGSKHCATDLPYACMDAGDDWYPDLCVGRFSVTSVVELQVVVDKTLFVEAGNFPDPEYVKRGAFLANPSTQGMAEPTHDWVIENLFEPNDYIGVKLYSRDGANTADVTNAVNNGCLWVGYYGHSGSTGWWDPSFTQTNVQNLSNYGLYGVAWSFSCNVGNYTIGECFGETWLREENKGAAAVIFPSDYIYWGSVSAWEPSTTLEQSFFRAIFEQDIWQVGPAWQAGLYTFLSESPSSTDVKRNFFELYNLMGDPSLQMPQPNGFNLTPTPVAYDLCCPPDTQAVYTVDVGQMGDFAEAVTLDLTDEPAGASVSFSVNGQVPPYTTQLTVYNLDGSMAGDYNMTLTGTSTSMQRSTGITLRIADGVPDAPTLVSPEMDATGIPLLPTLTWDAVADAVSYDIEIATEGTFTDIVISTTVTDTSYQVETALDMLTTYYWHVRSSNACGTGSYSNPYMFTTVNMIMPTSYDLLNGETGTYTYFDDAYDGNGDNTQPLAPLTDGLGDLTDGVIATQHWNSTNEPYIGWVSVDPTITFRFAESMRFDVVTLHLDDDGGGGGVHVPTDVTIKVGTTELVFPCTDPTGSEPFAFSCTDLDLEGDTLELTLSDYSTSGYMMLSEVEFYGGPNKAVCCHGYVCYDVDPGDPLAPHNEADCIAEGGTYLTGFSCTDAVCDCGGTDYRGDSNCLGDGVDAYDIDAFILAVGSLGEWAALYPCDFFCANDINCDADVNSYDIDWFIACVGAGVCDPCP
ncbi:MAG: C25 family cysteine peptidase [Planctomycetota bacterium]